MSRATKSMIPIRAAKNLLAIAVVLVINSRRKKRRFANEIKINL